MGLAGFRKAIGAEEFTAADGTGVNGNSAKLETATGSVASATSVVGGCVPGVVETGVESGMKFAAASVPLGDPVSSG